MTTEDLSKRVKELEEEIKILYNTLDAVADIAFKYKNESENLKKSFDEKPDDESFKLDELVLYKIYEDGSTSLGYIEEIVNKNFRIRDKFDWRRHPVGREFVKPFNEKTWKLLK